jgi:CBS domain-containing protein
MITINRLLEMKGHDIWSISPDALVYSALRLMAEKNVGALLVNEDERVVGIISERDYARKIILKGKRSADTLVREIMTHRVISVTSDQPIEHCMELMTENRVRHLPVYTGEQLVGIISIGDVIKAIISEQEFVIEQLENYIAGR